MRKITIARSHGIDDAGAGISNESPSDDIDCKHKYTVIKAGLLKLRLRALNHALTQTPFDQHQQIPFDDIVNGILTHTHKSTNQESSFLIQRTYRGRMRFLGHSSELT